MIAGAPNYDVEREREFEARVAFNARCLELARHNGFPLELHADRFLVGTWWSVPVPLIPVLNCQFARVA